MIPVEYHQNIFENAKRGQIIDFVITKVPNSSLNFYAGRSGRIRNIRIRNRRIEWLDLSVDSLGYGSNKLVRFTPDHITLKTPVVKKIYTDYKDYDQKDNIVDESFEVLIEEDYEEPDIYDDEDPRDDDENEEY